MCDFRIPHGSETVQDVPRVMSANRGGGGDRGAVVPHVECARVTADAGHLFLVHAAADYSGRRLLHAQQTILRPPRHHPAVRCRWHHLQRHHHRYLQDDINWKYNYVNNAREIWAALYLF